MRFKTTLVISMFVLSVIILFGCTTNLQEKDLDISISNSIDTRPNKIHSYSYDSTVRTLKFLSNDSNEPFDYNQIIIESFVHYENMSDLGGSITYNVYEYDAFDINKASRGEYDSHYYFAISRIFAFSKRLQFDEQGFDKKFTISKCNSYEDEWIKANCFFNRAILTKNKQICNNLPENFIYYGQFQGSQGHGPNSYSLETRPVIHWNMKRFCNEIINVLEINDDINFEKFCTFALQGTTGYLNEDECEILS